ncbi:MAG: protease inhibitor I42 family protein [Clostridia bacterium]|nr:protease inhibitor I42 family protein [Clostridia bacterium]
MKKAFMILVALMMLVTGVLAEDVTPEDAAPAEEVILFPFGLVEEDGKYFIELEGNPSTGYVWTAFSIVDDVVNVKDAVILGGDQEGTTGAPATYRFEVEAVNPGETIVVFRFFRPWEMVMEQEIPVLVNVDEEGKMFFMHLEGMPMEMTVVEVMADEHMALLENENLGQVLATFGEDMPLPMAGETIKVWSNGVMALSFPGRINVLGWETVAPPQARMMPAPADGE